DLQIQRWASPRKKEAVVPSSAGSANINPPINHSDNVDAFADHRESVPERWGPAALEARRERTRDHLAKIAARRESWINRNRYYYELLNRLFRFLIEPKQKVLSVRCGTGNLLGVVEPSNGKGVEIFHEIVTIAHQRNPSFGFAVAFPDKEEFQQVFRSDEKFDYILFNDVGDTVDVLQALRNLRSVCH